MEYMYAHASQSKAIKIRPVYKDERLVPLASIPPGAPKATDELIGNFQHTFGISLKQPTMMPLLSIQNTLKLLQCELPRTAMNVDYDTPFSCYVYLVPGAIPVEVRKVPLLTDGSALDCRALAAESERLLEKPFLPGKKTPRLRVTVFEAADGLATYAIVFTFCHRYFDGKGAMIIVQTFMDLYCHGRVVAYEGGDKSTLFHAMTSEEVRTAGMIDSPQNTPANDFSPIGTEVFGGEKAGFPAAGKGNPNSEATRAYPEMPSTSGKPTNLLSCQTACQSRFITLSGEQTQLVIRDAKSLGVSVNSYVAAAYTLALAECVRPLALLSTDDEAICTTHVIHDLRRFLRPEYQSTLGTQLTTTDVGHSQRMPFRDVARLIQAHVSQAMELRYHVPAPASEPTKTPMSAMSCAKGWSEYWLRRLTAWMKPGILASIIDGEHPLWRYMAALNSNLGVVEFASTPQLQVDRAWLSGTSFYHTNVFQCVTCNRQMTVTIQGYSPCFTKAKFDVIEQTFITHLGLLPPCS